MHAPALIALDWGTSSFRAYLLSGEGEILEQISRPQGIITVAPGQFETVFEDAVGHWLAAHQSLPVIASGMVGSRQGWMEVPYAPCPAGTQELTAGLTLLQTAKGRRLWLVPGLRYEDTDGIPDVIRGEEVQLVGAGEGGQMRDGVYVFPGTHSKWAVVEGGRIVWFATFMTGEMFSLLRQHSILGRPMTDGPEDAAAFRKGVEGGLSNSGLLNRLFSVRTYSLFGMMPDSSLSSYLSGLLIGAEIAEARQRLGQRQAISALTVVGGAKLAPRYVQALEHAGLTARAVGEEATVRGLFHIARTAELCVTAG
ncbi:2-dehydro-3-deoxygalactonokinase [Telmatospirillum sp. J64-1]|uniref:2-dehydro-3-deoxygalactonokinase n=1 Tax=Telmatospirillum sp. J64-1 TaxID=2502183 RepID=UPI00163D3D7A|nr:2-dehydro-3-deoxygalactonokinase [Telmatospirillum sp. J64-1]